MLPDPIKNFVDSFSKLPSIGPRQATRLAFYISSLGKSKVKEIADSVSGLNNLTTCPRCFRIYSGNPSATATAGQASSLAGQAGQAGKLCSICGDPTRNQSLIAIIEKETDLLSLEKTRKFNGWYLILGELHKTGELEPEQKLRLASLKNFINPPSREASAAAEALADKSEGKEKNKFDEIILAINPTVYGDLNASLIKKELEEYANKITRLGRGIPTGGEIEFADEDTLASALDKRS